MTINISFSSRIWIALFAVWLLLLSGLFSRWVGSPGASQALQLADLLRERKQQLAQIESEASHLSEEANKLSSNRHIQEREVRRVLGYVARDELVFDFTALKN